MQTGQKVLLGNHHVPFVKSQKLCELRSGPYIVTKVFKQIIYEIALDADPTRTQVVQRNHLVEYFLVKISYRHTIQIREAFQRWWNRAFLKRICKEPITSVEPTNRLICWTTTIERLFTYFSWHSSNFTNGHDIQFAWHRWQFPFDVELFSEFCRLWFSSLLSSNSCFTSIGITSDNQSNDYTEPFASYF